MGHDSTTPYATPQSDVITGRGDYLEVIPAGRWKRFFNFFIDYIVMYVLIIVIAIFAGIIAGEAALLRIENIGPLEEILFGFITYFGYYIIFEGAFGKTPGKLVTGTAVVNEHGGKPTLKQFLNRSLCRLIPFEPFSFLGSNGYGWHDSIPNTYVIDIRKQKR